MRIVRFQNKYKHLLRQLKKHKVVILSGASASGKSFITEKATLGNRNIVRLVSYTTRPRRRTPDGDYVFVTKKRFDKMKFIKRLEFPKNSGNWYGYSVDNLNALLKSDKKIIIILAPSVIKFYQSYFNNNGIDYVSIYWFVKPEIMKKRYIARAGYSSFESMPPIQPRTRSGSQEDLKKRLQEQENDKKYWKNYNYVVDGTKEVKFKEK